MGRPAALSDEQIALASALKHDGYTWHEIGRKLKCHEQTVRRMLARSKNSPALRAVGALTPNGKGRAKRAVLVQNPPDLDYLPDIPLPDSGKPIEETEATYKEIQRKFRTATDDQMKAVWGKLGLDYAKFLHAAQQEQQSAEDAGVDRMAQLTMRIDHERDKLRREQEGKHDHSRNVNANGEDV